MDFLGYATSFLIGYALANLFSLSEGKIGKYFRTPSSDMYKYEWVVHQLLGLFSTRLSEKWYGAYTRYGNRSTLIATLCTLGIIKVLVIMYIAPDDTKSRVVYKYLPFTSTVNHIKKHLAVWVDKYRMNVCPDYYVEEVLLVGYGTLAHWTENANEF